MIVLVILAVPVALLRELPDKMESREARFCTLPAAATGGASAVLLSSAAHLTRLLAAAWGARLLARFRAA